MDTVEFIKQINRLCEAQEDCKDCPLIGHACDVNTATIMSCYNIESVQKMVQIVEQWAKDNPIKTRQSEFLKIFPKAIVSDGAIALCPQFYCVTLLGTDFTGCKPANCANCAKCRREYWLTEVTDND